MADTSEILRHILSDEKLMSSKLFQDKVYTDQPSIRRGSQISRPETPPEIKEMKAIAYTPEAYWKTSVWLFYTQGKFMENFSDVFDYSEDFVRYYPTYRDLTTEQLRGYFSRRTRLRAGETPPAPLPFVFMHAYELINGIGIGSPEDGYRKLMELRHVYGANDNSVKRYLSQWLTDYAVYYSIDPSLIKDSPDIEFDRFLLTLINWEDSSDEELWSAIFRLSSFPIAKSHFYETHKTLFRMTACRVFRSLSEFFRSKRKHSLVEKYFGQRTSDSCRLFDSAVFYDSKQVRSANYTINSIHSYWCVNGQWFCDMYRGSRGRNKNLGDLIRTVDSILRERSGSSHKTKPGDTTQNVIVTINKVIDELIEEKRRIKKQRVDIDVSKLGSIRRSADSTREKLLVDADEEAYKEETAEAPADTSAELTDITETATTDEALLDAAESAFLHALLYGDDWKAAAREYGTMPSLLSDSVNEKLFDIFGDTVIDCSSDVPELIEDYSDELKRIVG